MRRGHVIVALSGGVDSSVAAALLLEQGHRVTGVTMLTQPQHSNHFLPRAQEVARRLNIDHICIDLHQQFNKMVVEPFCRQYASGLTPNPCILCNVSLKFGVLLDWAINTGADFLATGHYARISCHGNRYLLLKGADTKKDQSYFLYRLPQSALKHLVFPLGDYDKNTVLRLSSDYGLDLDVSNESQDICFLPGINYRELVSSSQPGQPGKIFHLSGEYLGDHNGIFNFTIGQRHGLHLDYHQKLYVIKIDYCGNRVVVGPEKALYADRVQVRDLSWISGVFPDIDTPVTSRVRYNTAETATSIKPLPGTDTIDVCFSPAVKSAAPGQSIVFYSGDIVLGGGIIQN